MPDLIGTTLGHYRIVDKIGDGGMGEIWRAFDLIEVDPFLGWETVQEW